MNLDGRSFWGRTLCGAGRGAGSTLAALLMLAGTAAFAGDEETISIGFENPEKFALSLLNGAKGEFSVTDELSKSGKYAGKLSYVFPPKGSYVLDEPHAPYAILRKDVSLGQLKEVSFWVKEDMSRNLVFLRVGDAKGENFQYKLGLSGSDKWTRYAVDFTKPIPQCAHWGGDKNGKIDYPIRTVGIEIRSFAQYGECRPNGILYFDDMTVVAERMEPGKAAPSKPSAPSKNSAKPPSPKAPKTLISLPNEKISVDGDLGEWDKSEPATLSKDACKVIEGTVKDDRDASAKIYSAFDGSCVYFAAEVSDDSVNGPYSGHGIWQNDGIELWFDCRFDTLSQVPLEDDYQVALSFTTKEGSPGIEVYRNGKTAYIKGAAKVASKKTEGGYIIEAAIPLDALLGLTDKKELPIAGFDASLCDNDGKSFSHTFWSGSHDGALTEYGVLTLGKLPPEQVEAAWQRKKEKEKETALASASAQSSAQDNKPRQGPPSISRVEKSSASVKKFEKFELTIDLGADYKNPFDPDDVSLQATFISPSGKTIAVDGFIYQFYSTRIWNSSEKIEKRGGPAWKVRFTPVEEGAYKYSLTLRDSQGRTAKTETDSFESIASELPGFLRVSKKDKLYLEYDSGKSFFGLGYNLHLWNSPNTLLFNKANINQIAAFGGNYASINLQTIGGGAFDLEGKPLGTYSLERAFCLDYVLDATALRGVYLIPCLNQTRLAMSQFWASCSFNKAKGGPCERAAEYFTSPEAKKLVKQRLRYTVARWGYSPNILMWELFNEVNYTEGAQLDPKSVQDWHAEMAQYLKGIDPNSHLITTSFGSGEALEDPAIQSQPEMDCVVTHIYSKDIAGAIRTRLAGKLRFGKPIIGGECGMPWPEASRGDSLDPKGIAFHNDIWASAMSHAAGNILPWWLGEYIEPVDAPRHMRAFAAFANDIKWHEEGFRDLNLAARPLKSDAPQLQDVSPLLQKSWSKAPHEQYSLKGKEIWTKIDPNSVKANFVADVDPNVKVNSLPAILFGSSQPELKADLRLELDSPQDTEAMIAVNAVAKEGASIEVLLDGSAAAKLELKDADGKDNPYAEELKACATVKLPKGKSELTLRNTGKGWAALSSLTVKGYAAEDMREKVRVWGLKGDRLLIFWLQNAQHTWYRLSLGEKPETLRDMAFEVDGMPEGAYDIQWWDTYEGRIFKTETLRAANGKLTLAPPAFDSDIACKVIREER